MTNFIKLHCMAPEKLASFLASLNAENAPWEKYFDERLCAQCDKKYRGSGEDYPCDNGDCIFDDSSEAIILEWLESEDGDE